MGWDAQDSYWPGDGQVGNARSGWAEHSDGTTTDDAAQGAPDDDGPARGAPRRLPGGVGALTLLLALVLLVPRLLTTGGDPEAAAREFLDALVAGDAAGLLEHLERPRDATDLALTDEILQGAEHGVTSYAIEDVEIDGEGARVVVQLVGDHDQRRTTLTLHAVPGSSFAPVTWELDQVAVPETEVTLPFGTEQVVINGVPVSLQEEDMTGETSGLPTIALQLLPGSYELSLPEGGELLEASRSEVTVPLYLGHSRSPPTTVHYELSEEGRARAVAQLEALLAGCAETLTTRPEVCPFTASDVDGAGGDEPSEGSWNLTTLPDVDVSSWEYGLWNLSGDGGLAEFTPADAPAETRRVPFSVNAFTQMLPDGRLRTDLVEPEGSFTVVLCSMPMDVEGTPQYVAVDPSDHLECEADE